MIIVAMPTDVVLVDMAFGGRVATRQAMMNINELVEKAPAMKGTRRPTLSKNNNWKVKTPTTLTTLTKPVTRLEALPAPMVEKI